VVEAVAGLCLLTARTRVPKRVLPALVLLDALHADKVSGVLQLVFITLTTQSKLGNEGPVELKDAKQNNVIIK